MARTGTIIAIVVIVVLIIVGGALGYTYLVQNQVTNSTSTTSNTSSSSTSSSTIPTTSSSTTTSSTSKTSSSSTTSTKSTSTTSSTTTSTSTKTTSYALQLAAQGAGPVLSSPLTTSANKTFLPDDNATVPYADNSTNNWIITGDFEPSVAWFSANSSGLTLTQQTQNAPHHEWNVDHEENVSELSGVIYGVSMNTTVYSIQVSLPNYSSIFANCKYDNNDNGCSYQGQGPVVSANWAVDVSGSNFDNSIAISVSEEKQGISVAAGTASIVNGEYVGGKYLGGFSESNFTSNHLLTISTDRKSFVELFVDNRLVYSNTTLPINMTGTGLALNFYQFTSVNNETISTTWSNVLAYQTNLIVIGNLTSGMSAIASGSNGFNATVPANSNGFAVIDASLSPTGVTIKVVLNGATIATYQQPVNVGTRLNLNVTSS